MPKSRKEQIESIFLPRKKRGSEAVVGHIASAPDFSRRPRALDEGDTCPWCGSTDPYHMPWECPEWEREMIKRRKEECETCRTTETIHMHHSVRMQAGKAIDFQ